MKISVHMLAILMKFQKMKRMGLVGTKNLIWKLVLIRPIMIM